METWNKIRGIENYEISNLNRVRSLDRMIIVGEHIKLIKGKIMRLSTLPKGYSIMSMRINGKTVNYYLHQLIALNVFDNYNPTIDHIDHIDGDVNNNSIENLRVVTNRLNHQNRKNKSTYGTGISVDKHKYVVRISNKDKYEYLGRYINLEDAQSVYSEAFKLIENNKGSEFIKIKIAPLQYKLIVK